jgi:hypothetical protein
MKTIYYCPSCGYVGHDTGYLNHDAKGNLISATCTNDCRYEEGGLFYSKGDFIELLEYDPVDDCFPDASEKEDAAGIKAVHKFLEKPLSGFSKFLFDMCNDMNNYKYGEKKNA